MTEPNDTAPSQEPSLSEIARDLKVDPADNLLDTQLPPALFDPSAGPDQPAVTEVVAEEPKERFRVEDWSGLPNYGCPFCSWRTLAGTPREGSDAVEFHILEQIDIGNTTHEEVPE